MNRSRRHVARSLLVALLAPLLVLLAGHGAQAATRYGTPATVDVDLGDEGWARPGSGVVCKMTGWYEVSSVALKVKYKAVCDEGWNVNNFEDFEGSVSFVGVDGSTGSECSVFDDFALAADKRASGTATSGVVGTGLGCAVGRVCLSGHITNNNMWDSNWSLVCAPVDLGPIPGEGLAGGTCDLGNVNVATHVEPVVASPGRVMVSATATIASNADTAEEWHIRVMEVQTGSGAVFVTDHAVGSVAPSTTGTVSYAYEDYENNYVIEGVQVYATSKEQALPGNGVSTVRPTEYPPQANNFLGITDASMCRFWFGEQTTFIAGEYDVPAGGLDGTSVPGTGTTDDPAPADADPPTKAAGCNFSITDPGSWLSGGICALVSLVRSLIEAVRGLPAGIASAFGDLLSALFVPDSSGMQSNVEDLAQTGTEAVTPWSDLLGQATPGDGGGAPAGFAAPSGPVGFVAASGGCSGPGFDMPETMTQVGLPSPWHPLAACNGSMAVAADWTRKISMAMLIIFALVKTVELIQAGLGVSTHVKIIGGADWSGAVRR